MKKPTKQQVLDFFLDSKKTALISLVVAVIVFAIRFIVCKNYTCALSFGIWALLIANMAFILFKSVYKAIKAVKEKKDNQGNASTPENLNSNKEE